MTKLGTINFILLLVQWFFVILPVPGYIHPDEYFQCPEIMAGDVFDLSTVRTWEWKKEHPVRNIIFPVMFSGIPFWLLSKLKFLQLSPQSLVILPRLMMAFITVGTEVTLRRISKKVGVGFKDKQFLIFLFRSSHVTLIFLNRTFSNNLETFLVTLLLSDILKKVISNSFQINWKSDFLMGAVFAFAFFLRQSAVAFCFFPLSSLAIKMVLTLPVKQFLIFSVKFGLLFLFGFLFASVLCITADNYYFSSDNHLHITPLNLMQYNSNIENLKSHGLHPWYLHFTVNMSLLFGPLYIVFLYQSIKKIAVIDVNNIKIKPQCLLTLSVLISVGILSLVPHQEPRFLIPIIVPMICSLQLSKINIRWFINAWVVFNIVGVSFYGFLHQAGLFPSFVYLHNNLKNLPNDTKRIDLVFWKTYKVPHYLLVLDNIRTQKIKIHDLGGMDYSSLKWKLQSIESDDEVDEVSVVFRISGFT